MMATLKNWIVGVMLLSFALSLAERMVVQESIRRLLRLAGGIVLTAVILSPLLELRYEGWELSITDYAQQTAALEAVFHAANEERFAAGIAEEMEAYIWDKANGLGLSGEVRVVVSEKDGMPLPERVELGMPFHEGLSEHIALAFGLGREEQMWQEE